MGARFAGGGGGGAVWSASFAETAGVVVALMLLLSGCCLWKGFVSVCGGVRGDERVAANSTRVFVDTPPFFCHGLLFGTVSCLHSVLPLR